MAKTDPLDPNVPAGSESPRLGNDRIQELARAVAEILNVDHYMGSDGGAGVGYNEDAAGEHKKVKFNAPISTPTHAANKLFLYGKDVGGKIELHVVDEDGNEIQLTSGGKLHSNVGFSMLSGQVATLETIQAVDSTGVVIKNDGGDTVITAKDDGKATLADGSQLATDAAPTIDADIVNKKALDTKEDILSTQTTAGIFGAWTTKDTENNSLLQGHTYQAAADGFVIVYRTHSGTESAECGYTDGSNPPATIRRARQTNGLTYKQGGFWMPVRKSDYWKVTFSGVTPTIYWLPIGTGGCVDKG